MDTLKHGVEEVNFWSLVDGMSNDEIQIAADNTYGYKLSSFCRRMCRECGWAAKPYTRQNRKIFEAVHQNKLSYVQIITAGKNERKERLATNLKRT